MASDRLHDLLAKRATQALVETEQLELDQLLRNRPDVDGDAYDRAAAAVHLAAMQTGERLPATVRKTLEQDAASFFRAKTDAA